FAQGRRRRIYPASRCERRSRGSFASSGRHTALRGGRYTYYRGTMTTEPVRTWESAEAAEVWRRSAARRARTVAAATDKMFEAASRVERPEQHFDAAICRFGLMFLPDLQAALERVHRALKQGARFAALVWSTEDRNPYISLQIDVVRAMGRVPSPPPSIVRTV